MPVELRQAQPDDAPLLAEVDAGVSANPWSQRQLEAACSVERASASTLVLDGAGCVDGFIIYSQVLDEASILNIAVHPARQGKGLGGKILRSALLRMRASGVTRCLLEVRESNTVARQLYQRHHFALDGVRKKYYPTQDGREDALLMSLEL